jgi:hypothetical protein
MQRFDEQKYINYEITSKQIAMLNFLRLCHTPLIKIANNNENNDNE